MKQIILSILLLPAFSSLTMAQGNKSKQTAPVTRCTLTLTQSPQLRGLRLGQNQAQVLARFPGLSLDHADEFGAARLRLSFVDADLYQRGSRDRGVQIDLTGTPAEGRSFTIDRSRFPDLKGVRRIHLRFVDGRIAYVLVAYDDSFKWNSVEEFAETVSKLLGLPDDWRESSDSDRAKNSREVRCDGFMMTAEIGGDVIDSKIGSQLTLEDTSTSQLIEKRRKDKEEQTRRAEEDRRKTFKP